MLLFFPFLSFDQQERKKKKQGPASVGFLSPSLSTTTKQNLSLIFIPSTTGLPFFNAEVAAAAHFLTSGALAPPLRPLLLPETAAPPPGKWPACR